MKEKIKIRNGRSTQNERELWHGSISQTIKLICEKGYDRGFAGKNGKVFYFLFCCIIIRDTYYIRGMIQKYAEKCCIIFVN